MSDNPFTYAHAANMEDKELENIFIDNDNSRIIDSKHNIFINGYRGTGKSMLMRYHSFFVKNIRDKSNFERIGIYVNCRNPYFARMDTCFNKNKFHVVVISEHILVLNMALGLLKIIIKLNSDCNFENLEFLKKELEYYFNTFKANSNKNVLTDFYNWLNKQIIDLQEELMLAPEEFIEAKTYSYLSLVDVVIGIFKEINLLKDTHFMFLIDDAVLLNKQQQQIINTWVSYRDTANVSFKVAITSADEYSFLTGHGSVILENHDYIMLDLEKNLFSGGTEFYKFAEKIINRRFEVFHIKTTINDFLPESVKFKKQLDKIGKEFIAGKYHEKPNFTKEQRKNNVSKYKRAIYFKLNQSSAKANLPELPYAGFNVLVNISTGIVRNLLVPCHKMYEKEYEKNGTVNKISEKVQYQELKNESDRMWSGIDNLASRIENCTNEDAQKLKNILENFGKYLKEVLLNVDSSEKRILAFTIEDLNETSNKGIKKEIDNIIRIGLQSGLLYARLGADHNGGKTKFYTPNRILWVSRGLDPVGQNGRKSFPAQTFYKMMNNKNYYKEYNADQLEIKYE